MAYNLRTPTSKTFYFRIDEATDYVRLIEVQKDEDHDVFISFRQATATDVEQRTQALSRREYRGNGAGGLILVDETNLDTVTRLEIFLTLTDTDINFPDGKPLEFKTVAGHQAVASRQKFDEYWTNMYPHWAVVFSQCCQKVNANWDPKRQFSSEPQPEA